MKKRSVVLALAAFLALLLYGTASADECYDCTQINVDYGGIKVLGTVCERYTFEWKTADTAEVLEETWTFTGQVNGQAASASGTWKGTWDGKGWNGEITSITKWDMGKTASSLSVGSFQILEEGVSLPQPHVPFAFSGRPGDANAAWLVAGLEEPGTVSIPVRISGEGYDPKSGKLPGPVSGSCNRSFSLTNVAGLQMISGLPRTGDVPGWITPLAFGLLLVGAVALKGAGLVQRR